MLTFYLYRYRVKIRCSPWWWLKMKGDNSIHLEIAIWMTPISTHSSVASTKTFTILTVIAWNTTVRAICKKQLLNPGLKRHLIKPTDGIERMLSKMIVDTATETVTTLMLKADIKGPRRRRKNSLRLHIAALTCLMVPALNNKKTEKTFTRSWCLLT